MPSDSTPHRGASRLKRTKSASISYVDQTGLFDVIVSHPSAAPGRTNHSTREKYGNLNRTIQLNSVYINPTPIYIPLTLVSHSEERLRIDFRPENWESVHGGTVELQLDNHNVTFGQSTSQSGPDVESVRSDSRDDISVDIQGDEDIGRSDDFNEMFNLVHVVNSIELEPKEKRRVILTYRSVSSEDSMVITPAVNPTESSKPTLANIPNTGFLDASTILLFTASPASTGSLTQDTWDQHLNENTGGSGMESNDRVVPTIESIAVPLHVRACKSNLECDVSQIVFDNCVPDGMYVKEFTIWNRSEIPLEFMIHCPPPPNDSIFTVEDYENGQVLNASSKITIPGYSHIRAAVTYRPIVVGEVTANLTVENLNNTSNKVKIKVHAVVTEHLHRRGLLIRELDRSILRSGEVLSFGDCFVGMYATRVLRIKNLTDIPLDVHLSTNCKGEVSFGLLADDLPEKPRNRGAKSINASDLRSSTLDKRRSQIADDEEDESEVDEDDDDDDDDDEGMNDEVEEEVNENRHDSDRESDDDIGTKARSSQNESNDDDQETESSLHDSFDHVFDQTNTVDQSVLRSSRKDSNSSPQRSRRRSSSPLQRDLTEAPALERTASRGSRGKGTSSKPKNLNRSRVATEKRNRSQGTKTDSRVSQQIQMLPLEPGMEQKVLIWYCPVKYSVLDQADDDDDVDNDATALRSKFQDTLLTKRDFYIAFRCRDSRSRFGTGADDDGGEPDETMNTTSNSPAPGDASERSNGKNSSNERVAKKNQKDKRRELAVDRYSRTVQVEAKACCSKVTVTPAEFNFGDCNIGERKRAMVSIFNHSDLPTRVQVLVQSKVVSVDQTNVDIGPRETKEVEVRFLPRKINPNYARAIRFRNVNNVDDVTTINVRASNMDPHHVIYHSLFYKLNTKIQTRERKASDVVVETENNKVNDLDMAQQIQFGEVTARSPTLECFELTNITSKPLRLRLSTSQRRAMTVFYDKAALSTNEFRIVPQEDHHRVLLRKQTAASTEADQDTATRLKVHDSSEETCHQTTIDSDLDPPLLPPASNAGLPQRHPWDSPGGGLYYKDPMKAVQDVSSIKNIATEVEQKLLRLVQDNLPTQQISKDNTTAPNNDLAKELTRTVSNRETRTGSLLEPQDCTTEETLGKLELSRHLSLDIDKSDGGANQSIGRTGAFAIYRRPRSYTEDVQQYNSTTTRGREDSMTGNHHHQRSLSIERDCGSLLEREERGLVSHGSWLETLNPHLTASRSASPEVADIHTQAKADCSDTKMVPGKGVPNFALPPLSPGAATGWNKNTNLRVQTNEEEGEMNGQEALSLMELSELFRPTERFFYVGMSPEQEENYVIQVARRMQLLYESISLGTIVRIQHDHYVELAPGATMRFGLLMTATGELSSGPDNTKHNTHLAWEQGKLRSTLAKVMISILDLDEDDLERLWKVHRWATYRASGHAGSGLAEKSASRPVPDGTNLNPDSSKLPVAEKTSSDVTGETRSGGEIVRDESSGTTNAANELSLALRQGIVPVREVPVVANVAQSIMAFAQKHINFGTVQVGSAPRMGMLSISNKAAVPLLYHISKSGSVASSFFKIAQGKRGVVRPYGKRIVYFMFRPTLAGIVEECLTVTNVADPSASQTTVVKANVIRQQNFALVLNPDLASDSRTSDSKLDFGKCAPGTLASFEHVVAIQSLSRRVRKVAVRFGGFAFSEAITTGTISALVPRADEPTVKFAFELDEGFKEISPEVEEKLEHLEHKLRIATRKNQTVKAESCNKKLLALRKKCGLASDGSRIPTNLPPRDPNAQPTIPTLAQTNTLTKYFVFELKPSTTLRLRVKAYLSSGKLTASDAYELLSRATRDGVLHGVLEFVEGRNEDTVQQVQFFIQLSNVSLKLPDVSPLGIESNEAKQCNSSTTNTAGQISNSSSAPNLLSKAFEESVSKESLKQVSVAKSSSNGEKVPRQAAAIDLLRSSSAPPFMDDTTTSNEAAASKVDSGVISLDKQELDFGCVTADEWYHGTVTISSSGSCGEHEDSEVENNYQVVGFENISDQNHYIAFEEGHTHSDIGVTPSRGTIQCGEKVSIQFRVRFVAGGHQRHRVTIRLTQTPGTTTEPTQADGQPSKETMLNVTIKAKLLYLHFVDLDPSCKGTPSVLDVGMCYANAPPRQLAGDWKAWAARPSVGRTAIKIRNVFTCDLVLNATSNVNRQVFVFSDLGLSKPVTKLRIPRGESATMYLTVKPRLLDDSWQGMSKTLRGSITISGGPLSVDEVKLPVHFECNVRFTGIMGISLMRVQPSVVNMVKFIRSPSNSLDSTIAVPEVGSQHESPNVLADPARGSFTISNINKKMPLRYHVKVTEGNDTHTFSEGCVINIENPRGELPGDGRVQIHFTLTAHRFGVLERRLVVENETESGRSQQHPLERVVSIRAIVHRGLISVQFCDTAFGPPPWLPAPSVSQLPWSMMEPVVLPPIPVIPRTRDVYIAMTAHDPFGVRHNNSGSQFPALASNSADQSSSSSKSHTNFREGTIVNKTEIRNSDDAREPGNTLISSQKDNMALLKSVQKFVFAEQNTYWQNLLKVENNSTSPMWVRPECRTGIQLQVTWESETQSLPDSTTVIKLADHDRELADHERDHSDLRDNHWVNVPQKHHAPPPLKFSKCGSMVLLPPGGHVVAHLGLSDSSIVRATPYGLIANARADPSDSRGRYFKGLMLLRTRTVSTSDSTNSKLVKTSGEPVRSKMEHAAMLWFEAPLCMSRFRIAKRSISAGKLGVINGWEARDLYIPVQNLVPILPLHLRILLPTRDGLTPLGRLRVAGTTNIHDKVSVLKDENSNEISVIVSQSTTSNSSTLVLHLRLEFDHEAKQALKRGNPTIKLKVLNHANPFNVEDVVLDGHMVVGLIELKFQDSFGGIPKTDGKVINNKEHASTQVVSKDNNTVVGQNRAVLLPPLTIPVPQATHPLKCNTWFLITNVYEDAALTVKFEIIPNPELNGIVELSVLSRMSNTAPTNNTIELERRSSYAIRVVMHPAENAYLWGGEQQHLVAQTMQVARLRILTSVNHPTREGVGKVGGESLDEVDVMGFLIPGQQVSLSSSRLVFYTTGYRPHLLDEGVRSSLIVRRMSSDLYSGKQKGSGKVESTVDRDVQEYRSRVFGSDDEQSGVANVSLEHDMGQQSSSDRIREEGFDELSDSSAGNEEDADDEGDDEDDDHKAEKETEFVSKHSVAMDGYQSPDESVTVKSLAGGSTQNATQSRAKLVRQKSLNVTTPIKRSKKRSHNASSSTRVISKPSAKISPSICLSTRSIHESFWITNESETTVLRFSITAVPMYQKGLGLLLPQSQAIHDMVLREGLISDVSDVGSFPRGSGGARNCVVTDNVTATVYPTSGVLLPNNSTRIVVWLSQAQHSPGVLDDMSVESRASSTITLLISNNNTPDAPPTQVSVVLEPENVVATTTTSSNPNRGESNSTRRGVDPDVDTQAVDFAFIGKMLDDNAAHNFKAAADQAKKRSEIGTEDGVIDTSTTVVANRTSLDDVSLRIERQSASGTPPPVLNTRNATNNPVSVATLNEHSESTVKRVMEFGGDDTVAAVSLPSPIRSSTGDVKDTMTGEERLVTVSPQPLQRSSELRQSSGSIVSLNSRDQSVVAKGYPISNEGQGASDVNWKTNDSVTDTESIVPQYLSIKLRGCTPVKDSAMRYEVKVGQRSYATGPVAWELSLESVLTKAPAHVERYRSAASYAHGDKQTSESVNDHTGDETGTDDGRGNSTMQSTGSSNNRVEVSQVEYKLYTVDEGDGQWVELSRSSGVLRGVHDHANVTLHFSTQVFGNFTTYLIVENATHSWDLSLIRLDMEVVSNLSHFPLLRHTLQQRLHEKRVEDTLKSLFSVVVNGRTSDESSSKHKSRNHTASPEMEALEVEVGELCATWLCSEVSFVIKNRWDIPLDFILSHNAPLSEVRFSTECEFLCEAQAVTVPPHSELRMYVFWVPGAESDLLNSDNQSEHSVAGEYSQRKVEDKVGKAKSTSASRRAKSSAPLGSMDRDSGVKLMIELYITCRLLKDFRKTICLKARVQKPQISLQLGEGWNGNNMRKDLKHAAEEGLVNHCMVDLNKYPKQFEFQNSDILFTTRTLVESVRGGGGTTNNNSTGNVVSKSSSRYSRSQSPSDQVESVGQQLEFAPNKQSSPSYGTWLLDPGCASRTVTVVNKKNKACYVCVVNNTRYFNIQVGIQNDTASNGNITDDVDQDTDGDVFSSPESGRTVETGDAGFVANNAKVLQPRFLYAHIPPGGTCTLEISLNQSAMLRDQEMLSRILHVEEHVTVNNFLWGRFHEFKRVKLRFSCGPYKRYSVLPTDKLSSYRLSAMEEEIGHFISEMNTMWDQVRRFPIFSHVADGEQANTIPVSEWFKSSSRMDSMLDPASDVGNDSERIGKPPASKASSLSFAGVSVSSVAGSSIADTTRSTVEPTVLCEMIEVLEDYLLRNPEMIGEEQVAATVNRKTRGSRRSDGAKDTSYGPYSPEERTKRVLARRYARAFFEFQATTDELVHYVCKPFVGRLVFSVANLLYGVALRHEVFTLFLHKKAPPMPSLLRDWWKQLQRFLNSVPHEQPMISQLRNMLAKFRKRHNRSHAKWKG